MPKKLDDKAIRDIEASVVPKPFRGKHEWPIEVEVLGQRARLRVIRGRKRICFDWYVPEPYREIIGQERFLQQVPKPSRPVPREEDPGHNPKLAIDWLGRWLRDQVLAVEGAKDKDGVLRDPSIPNDVPLGLIVERFLKSARFDNASDQQKRQWRLWLDFFEATLTREFRMHQVSADTLETLHSAYQKDWTRTLPDGTTAVVRRSELTESEKKEKKVVRRPAGPNTAAKVVRFLGTLCSWAVGQRLEGGASLLDTNPLDRIATSERRKVDEHLSMRRKVDTASDEFAFTIVRMLRDVDTTGQALLIFGTEVALGRRPGEVRTLPRHRLLTTVEEINEGLRTQLCGQVIPGNYVEDGQFEQAAEAYAQRGWAIHFQEGKQLALRPNAIQHDRVVPLGRHLTAVYRRYLHEHWNPRNLNSEAPLCAAATDPKEETNRHVAQKWMVRARKKVSKLPNGPKLPRGTSHPLRHRFRARHAAEDDRVVAFVGGWSVIPPSAMNRYYNPLGWQQVVEFIDRVDETTAKCLDGVFEEAK